MSKITVSENGVILEIEYQKAQELADKLQFTVNLAINLAKLINVNTPPVEKENAETEVALKKTKAAKKEEIEGKAEQKNTQKPLKKTPGITRADIKELGDKLIRAGRPDVFIDGLAFYGAPSVSAVPEDKIEEFYNTLKQSLIAK